MISRDELQVKQLIAKWSTNRAYSQENIGDGARQLA